VSQSSAFQNNMNPSGSQSSHSQPHQQTSSVPVSVSGTNSQMPHEPPEGNNSNLDINSDVFFNSAPVSSMNSAPVIPTSSQYGLAIVTDPSNQTADSVLPATTSEASSGAEKQDSERDHVHNRYSFVVVCHKLAASKKIIL